jgi:hypothetical protein
MSLEIDMPPDSRNIGIWIDNNKGDYFAEPVRQKRTRRVGSDNKLVELAPLFEELVTGFKLSTDMLFTFLRGLLQPNYPNITPEECLVVPILSRTHIRLFWSFGHYEYVDWDKVRRIGTLEWSTDEAPLKDPARLDELTSVIVAKFWTFVEEPLRAKWGPGPDPRSPIEQ